MIFSIFSAYFREWKCFFLSSWNQREKRKKFPFLGIFSVISEVKNKTISPTEICHKMNKIPFFFYFFTYFRRCNKKFSPTEICEKNEKNHFFFNFFFQKTTVNPVIKKIRSFFGNFLTIWPFWWAMVKKKFSCYCWSASFYKTSWSKVKDRQLKSYNV